MNRKLVSAMIEQRAVRVTVVAGALCFSFVNSLCAQVAYRTFERIQTIGSAEGAPEYTFGLLADATFAADGNILALDAANSVVRVYDRRGRHVRSIGRSGSGPGEFQRPTMLVVTHDRIRVVDPVQSRYVEFRTDGSHVETSRVENVAPFPVAVPVRYGHRIATAPNTISISGALVRLASQSAATIQRQGGSARASSFQAVALARSGEIKLDTLILLDHGMIFYLANRGVGMLRYMFGAQGGWALAGDSMLATVDGYTGAVRLLEFTQSGSRLVWSARASITPEPLSPRDMESLADLHWRSGQKPATYHLLGPSHKPRLGKPIIATNGDVWIPRVDIDPRRQGSASDNLYLIIPRSGPQELARFPQSSEVMAVDSDMVLVRTQDDWGATHLTLWQRRD